MGLPHPGLDVDEHIGLHRSRRSFFGGDDLLAGDTLHNCRLSIVLPQRGTADKLLAAGNFGCQMLVLPGQVPQLPQLVFGFSITDRSFSKQSVSEILRIANEELIFYEIYL